MRGVLASGFPQRSFTEKDHPVETLILDRPDKSFGVGIQIGRAVGQADDLDTGILQKSPERTGELGVPVEDEEALVGQHPVERIGEVPTDLNHPRLRWAGSDSGDVDTTRCEFDHEEHVERHETTRSPDLDNEEVGGGEHVPMGLEELAPRRSLAPLGSGIDAVVFKDVADRGASNSMAHIPERSLDSRVAPARVLLRHADDQLGDDLHDPRSAGGMTLVRPLLGNQLPVPSKGGVGSDERRNLGESPSADCFAAHGKPPPLCIGQLGSLASKLLL